VRSDVSLWPLDESLLVTLLHAAVEDADPSEVMPPVPGPAGWTPVRRAAFVEFHRSASLGAEATQDTFAIAVDTKVVGAARLCPLVAPAGAVEAGLWVGRSDRGAGVGRAVLELLRERARSSGFEALFVRTQPDNTAVQRVIASWGVALVRNVDEITAWVDLAEPGPLSARSLT
jgi:RimJ/RimL family protein N-acetyltransferase